MTTLTLENTIAKGTYFKRSTGMTGQVIASPELKAKLERVEELYQIVYGKPLGRYALYRLVLAEARDAKADVALNRTKKSKLRTCSTTFPSAMIC